MLINYIIIAHHQPDQLERLVRRLNNSHVSFYIHIDKAVDDTPFKELLDGLTNVCFLEGQDRKNTPWADIGFVYATLSALRRCILDRKSKGYCILLSGMDYPIVDNKHIHKFLDTNYGKNFISIADVNELWPEAKKRFERFNFHLPDKRTDRGIYPISDRRFLNLGNLHDILFVAFYFSLGQASRTIFSKRRSHPQQLVPKGGSAWWALPIETIVDILEYLEKHPDFLEYHMHTHVPDETFFHTLVHDLKSASEIDRSITYVNWTRKEVALPVTFHTPEDYNELIAVNHQFLFARKFEVSKSSNILNRFDQIIIE